MTREETEDLSESPEETMMTEASHSAIGRLTLAFEPIISLYFRWEPTRPAGTVLIHSITEFRVVLTAVRRPGNANKAVMRNKPDATKTAT